MIKKSHRKSLHSARVSVALATCNGERFLRELLESIASQSHRVHEVVAVDDASDDSTVDVIKSYRSGLKLRIYKNKNRFGYVANFERAISLCKGDFIALADQDDVWLPEKIEALVNAIQEKSLVCSDLRVVNESGETIAGSFRDYQGLAIPPEGDEFRYLALRNYVTGSSLLFRRELYDRAIPFPTKVLPHDWWLALQASCIRGIRYVDKPLTLYRQHPGNAIGAKRRPSIADAIRFGLSREERSQAYEQERKRFLYLLERGVYPNNGGREFLNDLIRYCDSHLNSRIHIDAVKIASKYHDVFFPGMGTTNRLISLLGKLLG